MKHKIKFMKFKLKQIFSHSSLVSINGINCYIMKMFVNKGNGIANICVVALDIR
jgi:hypothetical protein